MTLCSEVLAALKGKTLATAESCTGGGIGAAITAVPGASKVFKGGVISYTNEVKERCLGVEAAVLEKYGAVSAPVAGAMASCNKDNGPEDPGFTKEELAEMAAVDRFAAANSVYRALGLLNELPDNWESKTYEPQVGVPVDVPAGLLEITESDRAKSFR